MSNPMPFEVTTLDTSSAPSANIEVRERGRLPAARPQAPDGAALLKGKRVLVTGGAGFIGSHIVDLLAAAGCGEIIVLDNMIRGRADNLEHARTHGSVRLVVGDIRNGHLLRSLVDGADTVFHQAALRITHCAVEPRAALEVMVDATFDLVEECARSGVRKIVMASSASVYGMADAFPITENQHPYGNRTLYGAAKCFSEGLLRSFNDMYGTNYIALRYFNVYGPRMDIYGRYTEVLIRWIERLAAGLPPIIFGDGSQTMDMIHVGDVARANILAAVSPASDLALNIGSGSETSLLELAHSLARVMGRPELSPIFGEERSINPVPRRIADTRASSANIGFEASIPLAAGLSELVGWWQGQIAAKKTQVAV